MNNSTVNFTITEASTTYSFALVDLLEMYACSFSFLVGLPTYSYILWLIVKRAESGVASMFFNINLSVCEIGICLNSLIFILCYWFLSLMPLEVFLIGLGITGRPLFQCLICVERYLAVVHPVTYLKSKPLRYRVICCTVAWIITLGSCLLSLLISPFTTVHNWFFSTQFLLFLFIQLFCLVAVLRALKQSGPGDRKREKEEQNHLKRRAFHLILISTVTMVIMYAPYTISGFFTIVTKQNIRTLWAICLLCYLLTGVFQAVFYLYRYGKLSCLSSVCS